MKKRTLMLFTYMLLLVSMVAAQTTKVTGIVISADDGEPVVGASILVKGTSLPLTLSALNPLWPREHNVRYFYYFKTF